MREKGEREKWMDGRGSEVERNKYVSHCTPENAANDGGNYRNTSMVVIGNNLRTQPLFFRYYECQLDGRHRLYQNFYQNLINRSRVCNNLLDKCV